METSAFLMKRPTPLGEILLSSDGNNLTGLWFTGQKYFATNIGNNPDYNKNLLVFKQANNWLDTYFAKNDPKAINIPLAFHGTDFQKNVWHILQEIPYGATCTYGDIADKIYADRGRKTAARAVGNAVGQNPISIIVPCHRVIGANGTLTGYAGGIDKKQYLLRLEGSIINKKLR